MTDRATDIPIFGGGIIDAGRGLPLDTEYLAEKLDMTGGHIRNALLRAAVLAARAGTGLTMDHVLDAARAEYRALGRLTRL